MILILCNSPTNTFNFQIFFSAQNANIYLHTKIQIYFSCSHTNLQISPNLSLMGHTLKPNQALLSRTPSVSRLIFLNLYLARNPFCLGSFSFPAQFGGTAPGYYVLILLLPDSLLSPLFPPLTQKTIPNIAPVFRR
jgi:hypothetical protein